MYGFCQCFEISFFCDPLLCSSFWLILAFGNCTLSNSFTAGCAWELYVSRVQLLLTSLLLLIQLTLFPVPVA